MMIGVNGGPGDNNAGQGFFFNSTTTGYGKGVKYLNSTQFQFAEFLGMSFFYLSIFSFYFRLNSYSLGLLCIFLLNLQSLDSLRALDE